MSSFEEELDKSLTELRAYEITTFKPTLDEYFAYYPELKRAKQTILKAHERALVEAREQSKNCHPYTQEWIAKHIGISRPTLAKWLKNPEMFTLDAVKKLAALQSKSKEEL